MLAALKGLPQDHESVQVERNEILGAIAFEDEAGEFSWKTVVWDTSGQKISYRIFLGFVIQMIQQLPGVSRYTTYKN